MTSVFTIIFLVFGLIIGSFLNVVIARFNTARSFGGRSICLSCNEELHWYDLVPIFSFLILHGRCRNCKSRFSWQYPAVEILTAVVFALLFQKLELLFWTDFWSFVFLYAYYAAMLSILVVIAVYDIKHKIIPDILSLVFGVLAFVGMFMIVNSNFLIHLPTMLQIGTGVILSLPFALLWLISRGRWMGLGDAKLILGLGWFLGLGLALSALVLSFWAGAVIGIILLILNRKYSMKSELPFAPFLIFSSMVVFFWEIKVLSLNL